MSLPIKRNIEPATESGESGAPIELRVLALLELKKRQLVRELAEVLEEYQQLSREIESKRIPIPAEIRGVQSRRTGVDARRKIVRRMAKPARGGKRRA